MARDKKPNTIQLLLRLPGQVIALAKAEINNAKNEVSGRIKNLGIGIALFVVALIILFWVIATLLAAAVAGLAVVWPVWLSALVISGAGLVVILLLVLIGIMLLKRGSPVPSKTIERVEEDFAVARNVKESTDQMMPQPGKKGNWR
jgi:hypothetical protein